MLCSLSMLKFVLRVCFVVVVKVVMIFLILVRLRVSGLVNLLNVMVEGVVVV